ncbi:MAG: DUF4276 family protein [Isosphaeraceae bacterium]
MARLLILVEGVTEETFVNEVLAWHLRSSRLENVSAKLMGKARSRAQRGGVRGWPEIKNEIFRHLKADPDVLLTLMVDYYGMPAARAGAWPGREHAANLPFEKKAESVESELSKEMQADLGDVRRFIPFVLMHEFEALLFSDCERFASAIEQPHLAAKFQAIRGKFGSPEEINDSPMTHPAQRIASLIPEYQKPLYGNIAVLEIGLERIRAQCPHFGAWLKRLENLSC